jgi:hypothetical protein
MAFTVSLKVAWDITFSIYKPSGPFTQIEFSKGILYVYKNPGTRINLDKLRRKGIPLCL